MNRLKLFKVKHEPGAFDPDAVYLIKRPGENGFDMKVSNAEGSVLHPLNCCSGDNPGGGTGKPVKVYTAILAQTGQDAPGVLQELQNDFGQSMEFGYKVEGLYSCFMPGMFTDRTFIISNAMQFFEGVPKATFGMVSSADEIELYCGSNFNLIFLEIRVYQ